MESKQYDFTPRTVGAPFLHPTPSDAALKLQYVGQEITEVPTPAVVIDVAVAKRNCRLMLDAASRLGLGFRAHVKTHKTTQLSKLQVGEASRDVRLVASTVSEIEHLLPWLLECLTQGKTISVLYGMPVAPSTIPRLAGLARALGPGRLGLFADHPDHVRALEQVETSAWPGKIPVWVTVDVGYHREGVSADSKQLADIAYALRGGQRTRLAGLYTHFGSSYGVNSPEEALRDMAIELEGSEKGAMSFLKCIDTNVTTDSSAEKVALSIGASPTVTAVQNLLDGSPAAQHYTDMLHRINQSFDLELHAGVYPLMDMQQLATRARPTHSTVDPTHSHLSFDDLGMRTLVEVASIYPDRLEKPEALVGAGCIVLGREPCKSYSGWGVVSPWTQSKTLGSKPHSFYDPEGSQTGWIVSRVAQEHGILTWEGSRDGMRLLQVGEKLLIWPNHACIAGAGFDWYLIVDSTSSDPDKIVDVWVRWRGW